MPYSSNFVLLGIHGTFGNSSSIVDERWTTTLKIQTALAPPFEDNLVNLLADVEPEISTHHADTFGVVGDKCFFTELSAAVIGPDGKYVGGDEQETIRAFKTTPLAGSGGTIAPYTTCIVRSLRTAVGRGRASNGRMYYPATAASVSAPELGRITTARAAGIAAATATMLNGINAAAETDLGVGSEVSVMSAVATGKSAAVTHVRVGCKLDHMESRERNIPENWQTAALA